MDLNPHPAEGACGLFRPTRRPISAGPKMPSPVRCDKLN